MNFKKDLLTKVGQITKKSENNKKNTASKYHTTFLKTKVRLPLANNNNTKKFTKIAIPIIIISSNTNKPNLFLKNQSLASANTKTF